MHSDNHLQHISKSLLYQLPSPCYAVEKEALARNLKILDYVQKESGAKILLALKGFAMWSLFPEIAKVLEGTCASGLYEAMLGHETFGKKLHTYSPAYTGEDLKKIVAISDHVIFNSFRQWRDFESVRKAASAVEFGLRINPEYSEAETEIYNPCGPNSRLGIRRCDFEGEDLTGVSGLHFHAHCQQNSDALERTLSAFDDKFGDILEQHPVSWLNWGGGHHITRPDYDLERLIRLIKTYSERYHAQIWLEPGEAVGLNTGILVATVLDIVHNRTAIAVLDVSVSCHMPDVMEMPYRPEIIGAGLPGEKAYTYLLAGNSCLAGDRCGEYSFDEPLKPGDRIVFLDMAHYTMVKTTFFNGVKHPAIVSYSSTDDTFEVIREFHYTDYKNRLS